MNFNEPGLSSVSYVLKYKYISSYPVIGFDSFLNRNKKSYTYKSKPDDSVVRVSILTYRVFFNEEFKVSDW